jgi:hypothetical protein
MILIVVYLVLVVLGEVIAFFVGQIFDSFVPSTWSMLFAMGLFFGVLWAAWPLAVVVTEKWVAPRPAAS